jgi:hypothetical protein
MQLATRTLRKSCGSRLLSSKYCNHVQYDLVNARFLYMTTGSPILDWVEHHDSVLSRWVL